MYIENLLLRKCKKKKKKKIERIKLGQNTLRGLGAHFMKGLINMHKIFIEKWLTIN
jgi:hypothetical protein